MNSMAILEQMRLPRPVELPNDQLMPETVAELATAKKVIDRELKLIAGATGAIVFVPSITNSSLKQFLYLGLVLG